MTARSAPAGRASTTSPGRSGPTSGEHGTADSYLLDHPVPAPLRGVIDSYQAYQQCDLDLQVHRGMPSTSMTFLVSLAEPVKARLEGESPVAWQAFAGGLQRRAALVTQDRYQCGVQLGVNPLMASSVLGMPAGELAGIAVSLDDLPRSALHRLPERLAETSSWAEAFAVLDAALTPRDVRYVPQPEVMRAWQVLLERGGAVRVSELAAAVGWSRRHLTQRFRQVVGLSPKQLAQLLRFERSRRKMWAGSRADAELAQACGYYDQAHLINDWRSIVGCTPREWQRGELSILQSDTAYAGAV